MTTPETGSPGPVLQEAARELEAAVHDAQVAFGCIALGELDRAHTNAISARAGADAALTARQAGSGRPARPPAADAARAGDMPRP